MFDFDIMTSMLRASEKTAIITHVDPDGDCLCSGAALKIFIETAFGSEADLFVDGKVPYNYRNVFREKTAVCQEDNENYSLVIVIDTPNIRRIGRNAHVLNNAYKLKRPVIVIDHHRDNDIDCTLRFVNEKACSSGEILFDYFMSEEFEVSKDMLEYIYAAVLTDTGKFLYKSVNARSHEIAAECIKRGADIWRLNEEIYNSKPAAMQKAYLKAVSSLEFFDNDSIAVITVLKRYCEENEVGIEELDGLVDFLREIDGVTLSCVVKEYGDNVTKFSLRSDVLDVSQLAGKYGGGGHDYAAGFTVTKPVDAAKKEIIDYLIKENNNVNNN